MKYKCITLNTNKWNTLCNDIFKNPITNIIAKKKIAGIISYEVVDEAIIEIIVLCSNTLPFTTTEKTGTKKKTITESNDSTTSNIP